jgi:hypothetical protein
MTKFDIINTGLVYLTTGGETDDSVRGITEDAEKKPSLLQLLPKLTQPEPENV